MEDLRIVSLARHRRLSPISCIRLYLWLLDGVIALHDSSDVVLLETSRECVIRDIKGMTRHYCSKALDTLFVLRSCQSRNTKLATSVTVHDSLRLPAVVVSDTITVVYLSIDHDMNPSTLCQSHHLLTDSPESVSQ